MNKIRKGDTVRILSGEDKDKTGTVQYVYPKKEQVIVAGVHLIKKAQKRAQQNVRTQTGIIEREGPLHLSKIGIVCPSCGKVTRVGFGFTDGGEKFRQCKKCGSSLDK